MTIYKYQLEVADEQKIKMPIGARILCVQTQKEIPCLWVLVDPKVKGDLIRTICIHGTGHTHINYKPDEYIGTFQLEDENFVFHVFEIINRG